MRLPIIGKVPREHLFDDEMSWEVPEPENHSAPTINIQPHDLPADFHVHHRATIEPMVTRSKAIDDVNV